MSHMILAIILTLIVIIFILMSGHIRRIKDKLLREETKLFELKLMYNRLSKELELIKTGLDQINKLNEKQKD